MQSEATATSIPAAAPEAIISTDRGSFSDGTERSTLNGPELIGRVGTRDDRLEFRALWNGYVDIGAWQRLGPRIQLDARVGCGISFLF